MASIRAVFRGGPLDGAERDVEDPPPPVFNTPDEYQGKAGVASYHRSSLNGQPFPNGDGRIVYAYVKTTRR